MARVFFPIGGGALTTLLAVVIAKSQTDQAGFWGWVLKDPHVVPVLIAISVMCFAIALGQWEPVRSAYTTVFNILFKPTAAMPSPDLEKLSVQKATWGSATSRKDVTSILNAKQRDGIAFILNSDALNGSDPAPGDDNKYIEIDYSYGDISSLFLKRTQRDWIVLPEDRTLKAQADLAEELRTKVALVEGELAVSERKRLGDRLTALKPSIDENNDILSVDDMIYQRIRTKFQNLPWQQKVALKRVWSRQSMPVAELILGLENSGFSNPKMSIVRPLLAGSILVETNYPERDLDNALNLADTEIAIKNSDTMKVLKKLFRETPLC